MRLSAIFFTFGLLCLALAAAMLIPMLTAIGERNYEIALSFAGTAVLAAFIGGGFALSLSGATRASGVREAVALMVLAWALLPVFAMLPAYAAGWPNDILSAYFEAVSALTTTGASQYQADTGMPPSLVLWRSVLHWMGGFGGIVVAVAVLTGVAPTALPVQTITIPHLERGALLARLAPVARVIAPIYGILTLIIFAFLTVGGTAPFDALCLTLSAIATGGVSAQGSAISIYGSPWLEVVVAIALLLGAMSFTTHRSAFPNKIKPYLRDIEAVWLIGFVIVGVLLVWWFQTKTESWPAAFTVLSLITTAGYHDESAMGQLPASFVLTLVLIGGSIVSTAGGIKMMRIILLLKQSGRELHRIARPHGIARNTVYGRQVNPVLLEPVWIYFVGLATAITLLTVVLALYLPSFEWAAGAAIAALSNTGPALHIAFPDAPGYGQMADPALIALCAGMILGRVEILALPILLTGSFWRF